MKNPQKCIGNLLASLALVVIEQGAGLCRHGPADLHRGGGLQDVETKVQSCLPESWSKVKAFSGEDFASV